MKSRVSKRKLSEWVTGYAFVLPNVAGLAIFVFIPIVYAFYVSLHSWDILGPKVFIGLDNYRELAGDTRWWNSVGRTALFTVVYVPLLFVSALFFAVVLNALSARFVNIVRTLYLLPFAITSIISAVIWVFLMDPRYGYINQFLKLVGLPAQPFLGSTSQALMSIVVVLLWINLGYNMMIFLATIKDIPKDYYEAANIDGATAWQSFRYITFPLLRGISIFIVVVTTIASFQVFDQIHVMTKGGPANATEVSVLYIYRQAFEFLNMGYASALAVVLFAIIFIFSIVQLRLYTAKN